MSTGLIDQAISYFATCAQGESITVTATVNTGKLNKITAIKFGRIVFLELRVTNTSAIASGSNLFACSLDISTQLMTQAVTFHASRVLIGQWANSAITVRVSSGTSVANNEYIFGFTAYI